MMKNAHRTSQTSGSRPATLETLAAPAGIPTKRLHTLLTAPRALALVGTDAEGSVGMPPA